MEVREVEPPSPTVLAADAAADAEFDPPELRRSLVSGDGTVEWHDSRGRPHRDDGPARVHPDGRCVWFEHGEKLREERAPAAND